MAGSDEVCVTDTLDVSVGTSQVGKKVLLGSGTVGVVGDIAASETSVSVLSLGSMKMSSGASPWLVTVTGAVTGVPAASVAEALSGRPTAEAWVWLNTILPVYGSDN